MIETIERQEVDKELLRKRFRCAVKTYNKHAVVQQSMAHELVAMASQCIPKYHTNMAEFGCGTGLLTHEVMQKFVCDQYLANDLVPDVAEDINFIVKTESTADLKFVQGDVENVDLGQQQNVIWSGATIQWIQDLDRFFSRLYDALSEHGYVALSSFDIDNFMEVKTITGKGIDYKTMEEVMHYAQHYFKVLNYKSWHQQLWFDTPREVLKHMRFTGVNSVAKAQWGKADLAHFNNEYEMFRGEQGYPLTYHPFIIILQK
ncbi:malonyl-ACP O-methyltransferase BioC [Labilibacter marinus]|uniref:malonyl-ACP O-methyltransferase BioC n=1 Tax=Labilibacter marinus TaxID=1477105 RepID=UPI0008305D02|nr:malonyl-ACP O-methyltransferase BioC [Labilibacter marinus]